MLSCILIAVPDFLLLLFKTKTVNVDGKLVQVKKKINHTWNFLMGKGSATSIIWGSSRSFPVLSSSLIFVLVKVGEKVKTLSSMLPNIIWKNHPTKLAWKEEER